MLPTGGIIIFFESVFNIFKPFLNSENYLVRFFSLFFKHFTKLYRPNFCEN